MNSQSIKPHTANHACHPCHPYHPSSERTLSPSHFLYVPACSRASRAEIEESSYDTTPDLSEDEETPPCGQKTYIPSEELHSENLGVVDAALRRKIRRDKHKKPKAKDHTGLENVVVLEAADEEEDEEEEPKEAKKVQVGEDDAEKGEHEEITSPSPGPGPGQKEKTESSGSKEHVKATSVGNPNHFTLVSPPLTHYLDVIRKPQCLKKLTHLNGGTHRSASAESTS